jgi:phosphate:Na+ symporter
MPYHIILVFGSLGLFLYGMKTMSDALLKVAGNRLQSLMKHITGTRTAAIIAGVGITAFLQSSTATTVMVVSFVNSGVLQLTQAISVIMGANIGTTITGWIVALGAFKVNVIALSLPPIGIGFVLLIVKKMNQRNLGEVFIGFGLLFLGLYFLKVSLPRPEDHQKMAQLFLFFANKGIVSYLFYVAVGILLTIIVQASSGAMALTLVLAFYGWIDYPTAAAIILGENVGTTLSANIASFGTSVPARQAGRAHTLFNLFGVFWMAFIFTPFLQFINLLVPFELNHLTLPLRLALFHTLFNVTNTLISFPLIKLFEKVVTKLVPHQQELTGPYSLRYIRASLRDTAELYLVTVKKELLQMADITSEMFDRFWSTFKEPPKYLAEEVIKQKEMEDLTDQMQEQITSYLSQSSMDKMNQVSAKHLHSMIRITNELETIGDSCFNLMVLSERKVNQNIEITEEHIEGLLPYVGLLKRFLVFIRSHLNVQVTSESMAVAFELENSINEMRNYLKESSSIRLQQGANVKTELLYIEVLRHIEQIGDHCLNVAEALARLS